MLAISFPCIASESSAEFMDKMLDEIIKTENEYLNEIDAETPMADVIEGDQLGKEEIESIRAGIEFLKHIRLSDDYKLKYLYLRNEILADLSIHSMNIEFSEDEDEKKQLMAQVKNIKQKLIKLDQLYKQ